MQASLTKVLDNKELGNVVSALGTGIGPKMDLGKLRYHKIFLLMDADSDGAHIATLLLTFFVKHMPQLVEGGHLFLSVPPLYRVEAGKETHYVRDDEEMADLERSLPKNVKPSRMRFKGLGEMNAQQLWETTLDPKRRRALRVQMDDDTGAVMQSLMGKDPAPRYRLIMEQADNVDAEELDV